MSTTVVYASGQSGYTRCQDATYLTAARGDGTLAAFPTNGNGFVGQTTAFRAYQSALQWDTSAIGSDVVGAVDFDVNGASDASTTDFTLEGYVYDWGATLTNADFRDSDTGIPALGSIISSYDTSGGWTTTAGYNQTMGALSAFDDAIDGAGDTRIVVISQEHRNESEPTGNEWVSFECTGVTNDARLTITHAPSNYAVSPTDDVTTTGWTATPLWSKIDDPPDTPDATVITATAS